MNFLFDIISLVTQSVKIKISLARMSVNFIRNDDWSVLADKVIFRTREKSASGLFGPKMVFFDTFWSLETTTDQLFYDGPGWVIRFL